MVEWLSSRIVQRGVQGSITGLTILISEINVDGFVLVGTCTNFRGLSKNYTFMGFKIHGYSIFLHHLYRKSFLCY